MNELFSSKEIKSIAPALLRAQMKMGTATKDSKNPFYKSSYADLNSIRETSIPVLNEEKIVVLQPTVSYDNKTFVRTLLLHESGEWMSSDTEIVQAKPNDPQAHGSGISYARRYGLQSFLNVGAVDDDAEVAMGRQGSPTKKETEETPKRTSSFRKPTTNGSSATKSADGWE